MREMKLVLKKCTAMLLVVIMFCGMLPSDLISEIDLSSLFSSFSALAKEVEGDDVGEIGSDTFGEIKSDTILKSAGSNFTAPECSFKDELYDGSDAISPLPSYKEYKEQTGYIEPLRFSLTDFRTECGEGLSFNSGNANYYMEQGYKLMICNAEELYTYSMLANGAGSPEEMNFYLSANIVLGDNIEYSDMGYNEGHFMPIGNDNHPFVGTFDGQCFEIRDLYFSREYQYANIGFFGVVGEEAEVRNFGLYHPSIVVTNNNSTYTAAIAAKNYGSIDSVYTIVQEYRNPNVVTELNVISTANAYSASGLVASNYESGVLSNSYFAGMLEAADPEKQNPVCAENTGTVSNCYYDKDVFASGFSGTHITEVEGEITGLNNIDLKRTGFSENGMQNTNFKANLASFDIEYSSTDGSKWSYPRLYGFTGTGAKDDPYIISTPADLIYFPTSAEYLFTKTRKYFQLEKCIDMNEVAPYAYKPKLDFTFYTNTKSGNNWVQQVNKWTNCAFYGNLSGAAHCGDENCSIHHVTNMGVDADGNVLQECHSILNLTINQPATAANDVNRRYTALIPNASSNWDSNYFATISDIHFIGGEISTGDIDCMPSAYNASAYNVKTATVVAHSDIGTDLKNVHSSATIKMGTGKQYSVQMGGLMAGGSFHHITDCTNSGDIIGGYVDMPGQEYLSENYMLGGLLGAAGSPNHLQERQLGKLTHVANYGNVYGVAVVAQKDSGWKLTGGSSCVAGISYSSISSGQTGNTTYSPDGQSSYYYDDSTRVDRVANFGMLFDGPVLIDENGNPLFDENGKPQALPLSEDKELVFVNSPKYSTYIYGIATNLISNSYNEGNIYSIFSEHCQIAGIGSMGTASNSTLNQYYNFLNYNVGNIYMYAGARDAHGISDNYAYKCYNSGGIYLLGGKITTIGDYYHPRVDGGSFSGISGYDSAGCYFDGEIYIAPSIKSGSTFSLAGCSQRYATYITEIDDNGRKVIIPTINNGKLTLDLDKNKFIPVTESSNSNPNFFMMGTGLGSYCYNYGTFDFIPNEDDASPTINLEIAGLGGLFKSNQASSIDNSINYADIAVDTLNADNSLNSLTIYGLGIIKNSYDTTQYEISNSANLGDISFKGTLASKLTIYALGYSYIQTKTMSNNISLGNIIVDDEAEINGGADIRDMYLWAPGGTKNQVRVENYMHGWYDGCYIPSGVNAVFSDIFKQLDKSKRYGQINISGTINTQAVSVVCLTTNQGQASGAFGESKNIVGNGAITVSNADLYSLSVNAISNFTVSESESNMPITLENVLLTGTPAISGGLSGVNNVNNAPIRVSHCLLPKGNTVKISAIANGNSISHCENRGDIIIKDCSTATVNGVEYKSPRVEGSTLTKEGSYQISGIGTTKVEYSVNFGDINVSDVASVYAGGISGIGANNNGCYNYGDILCDDIGVSMYLGGICAQPSGTSVISNCYNFATVTVKDPNSYSYSGSGHNNIFVGGIVGYGRNNSGSISCCVNYGEVIYNNTQEENTGNTSYDNTRNINNIRMSIGGVVGCNERNVPIYNSANYANITVLNEENTNISAGGITGAEYLNTTNTAVSTNLINYGNITVPDANTNMGQKVCCGGIIGEVINSGEKLYEYGINYGTVQAETTKATNTYVGAFIGSAGAYYYSNYDFNKFVDLSDPPSGVSYYPLVGYKAKNNAEAINYTKNDFSITDTASVGGTTFGTIELVTLDKQQNGGLFSADFPFRADIIQQISPSGVNYQNNDLIYQDFEQLSPYLQKYMAGKFGDDIKNYGAYVMPTGRLSDDFIPGEIVSFVGLDEIEIRKIKESLPGRYIDNYKEQGEYLTFFDEALISNDINSIYSTLVSPSKRSMLTDYNIYQQQVDESGIAELHEIGLCTAYSYLNADTGQYQKFSEYQSVIQTRPAYDSSGNVSDTVTYTDINFYVAIDDINSHKTNDDEFGESGDTSGIIYFTQDYIYSSAKSNIQLYTGDVVDITDRLDKMNHYTDCYPEPWLTADNLNEKLAVTDDWGKSNGWDDQFDEADKYLGYTKEDIEWSMAVPFTGADDTKKVYTKVLGVATAEDGVHKNIIVAHVVLDRYKPYSELNSVELNTPDDNVVKSTVENGLVTAVEGMPSVTDKFDGEPVKDVTYYYLNDGNLTGENIQQYNWEQTQTYPQITLNTYNMDSSGKIYWKVYRQDTIPAEGEKYNDLRWNGLAKDDSDSMYVTNPINITFDENQKSVGTAIITFNNENMFYGGYYKVELYYERTKDSDTQKHFATVFIAKEYSPHNSISDRSLNTTLIRTPYETGSSTNLPNQTTYDETHELVDGMQTGYIAYPRKSYNSTGLSYYYYPRESNDCRDSEENTIKNTNYNKGHGLYYGLKGYLGDYPSSTYYIDQDNPLYQPDTDSDTDSDVSDTDTEYVNTDTTDADAEASDTELTTDTESQIPKGKAVTLEQNTRSVYVYRDDTTGAFYPILFQGVMDIMAENGDIRRYTVEHIQNGAYGENDEYNYENPVNIYQLSASKNGYPITAQADGTHKAIAEGDEVGDIEFRCAWYSSNVGLSYTDDLSKSGFNSSRIRVFYTPFNSTNKVELTLEQINESFSTLTCNTGNNWIFKLKNSAPIGTYEMVPYVVHINDFSTNPYKIKLYDSETKEFISESEDNILKWTIPYSQPFVIENRPNDESYLLEYNTSNDQYTPFIVENSNVEGSDDRDVYIRPDSKNQEITYVGYKDVKDEDVNFNIYSYVSKTSNQSDLRMKAPYMATVTKWVGDSSPFETITGTWEAVTPTSDTVGIKEYNFHVEYNELLSEGTLSYKPSVTYYKVTAEDGITSTIYAVYVVPGVRNKFTTLEIAQEEELSEITGSQAYKDTITEMFAASDEIYQEILDKHGSVTATIKELNGNTVDLFQTKFFDGKYLTNGTEPYVYNLKSFAFDISVDLPAGYDYDIILLSNMKDSYSTLKDSQNGFDGKQLLISNSDDQQLHIRIILKRDNSYNVWGVQHIWNFANTKTNKNGQIQNNGGGYFYNYVYKRDE